MLFIKGFSDTVLLSLSLSFVEIYAAIWRLLFYMALQPDDPAGNFIKIVEEAVANNEYPFRVVMAWQDNDDVPRIAYRTQETTEEAIWMEATQFISVLVNVFQFSDSYDYDLAPDLVIGVTLPHIDSDRERATAWELRREWVDKYEMNRIGENSLLEYINETRDHVVERELLAADGEDSLDWN